MSAPTITPAARVVSDEIIDCYTEDARALGLDDAASVAGVLAAYVDTYFIGRHDTLDITGRETLMAEKIVQAFTLLHDLPCLCDTAGLCRRCRVIGEDELLDIPVDAAAEVRTARIIAEGLAGLELPSDKVREISGAITVSLWMAKLLASSADTTPAASLRANLFEELALQPDVSDEQIVKAAGAYRRALDSETRRSQEFRNQLKTCQPPNGPDLTAQLVHAIASNQAMIPDEDDRLEWERIRSDAAAAERVFASLQQQNQQLRDQINGMTRFEADPELCGACVDMNNGGPCPFHAGHLAGALHLAQAIGAICADIELADRVHDLIAQRES
jgi:hypothetical protein